MSARAEVGHVTLEGLPGLKETGVVLERETQEMSLPFDSCPRCPHLPDQHRHVPPKNDDDLGAYYCTSANCRCAWDYPRDNPDDLHYNPNSPLP